MRIACRREFEPAQNGGLLPLFNLSSSVGGSQPSSSAPKIVENPIRFRSQSFAEEDFFLNKEKNTAILSDCEHF